MRSLTDGLRIGLLGGSFNPAHDGHRQISLEALRRLQLDQVWWLVSPQNPLKSADDMAPLDLRMKSARSVARHPLIRPTDIETHLGTRFTADTLVALTRRFPRSRFVWLMGADNLVQISSWDRWTQIFNTVPVAIFDRPSYTLRALAGTAARRYRRNRLREREAPRLAGMSPPAWIFLHIRLNPASATQLRARRAPSPG